MISCYSLGKIFSGIQTTDNPGELIHKTQINAEHMKCIFPWSKRGVFCTFYVFLGTLKTTLVLMLTQQLMFLFVNFSVKM